MSERFIKYIPSDKAKWLRKTHPNAYLLLSLIAERARRISGEPDGLEIGDAKIGDHASAGLSAQEYRTAKDKLVILKIIKIKETNRTRKKSTTGSTTEGTLVTLLDLDVWDINPDINNDCINHRATTGQRLANDEQERIRKNKKEEVLLARSPEAPSLKVVGLFNSHEEQEEQKPLSDVFIDKNSTGPQELISETKHNIYYPTENQLLTTENKKIICQEKNTPVESFGEQGRVKLTKKEYENLLNKMSEAERSEWIEEISLAIGVKGEKEFNKKYKSHYCTILSWKKLREKKSREQGFSQAKKMSLKDKIIGSFKNGETYLGALCHLNDEGIAFDRGIKHGQVKFGEWGDEEKFRNMLHSFGIHYLYKE